MLKLVMMISIVNRKNSEDMISFFNKNNVPLTLGRYGRGTATDVMLDYLGIDEKERCIAFSFLNIESAINIATLAKKKLKEFYSFAIPISSIGGKNIMEHLENNIPENLDNSKINYKFKNELILVITNRGYVENVMQIARDAGAPGGTVIHARGTGVGDSETFFGVTIGAEKEMIFIVTEREKRDIIMEAIMHKAGNDSPAGSILFSLPVTLLGNDESFN